jgi:hypothetical protein
MASIAEIDLSPLVRVQTAMRNAIAAAMPYGLKDGEERYEATVRFSTDPEGLGMTISEFQDSTPSDWLVRFRRWAATKGRTLQKQGTKGRGGRPAEGKTELIHSIFQKLRAESDHEPTLSELARKRFGPDYTAADAVGRKKKRDLVGAALRRSQNRD